MKRWEMMEEWLFDHEVDHFNSVELAQSASIHPQEASRWIGAYLTAQRAKEAKTLYVLKREGRTTKAVWSVGQRTSDAKVICGVLFDDVTTKIKRAFEPDLKHLAERNPAAARYVEAKLEMVIDGALKVMSVALAP